MPAPRGPSARRRPFVIRRRATRGAVRDSAPGWSRSLAGGAASRRPPRAPPQRARAARRIGERATRYARPSPTPRTRGQKPAWPPPRHRNSPAGCAHRRARPRRDRPARPARDGCVLAGWARARGARRSPSESCSPGDPPARTAHRPRTRGPRPRGSGPGTARSPRVHRAVLRWPRRRVRRGIGRARGPADESERRTPAPPYG